MNFSLFDKDKYIFVTLSLFLLFNCNRLMWTVGTKLLSVKLNYISDTLNGTCSFLDFLPVAKSNREK